VHEPYASPQLLSNSRRSQRSRRLGVPDNFAASAVVSPTRTELHKNPVAAACSPASRPRHRGRHRHATGRARQARRGRSGRHSAPSRPGWRAPRSAIPTGPAVLWPRRSAGRQRCREPLGRTGEPVIGRSTGGPRPVRPSRPTCLRGGAITRCSITFGFYVWSENSFVFSGVGVVSLSPLPGVSAWQAQNGRQIGEFGALRGRLNPSIGRLMRGARPARPSPRYSCAAVASRDAQARWISTFGLKTASFSSG
jgi:hypothetical protein